MAASAKEPRVSRIQRPVPDPEEPAGARRAAGCAGYLAAGFLTGKKDPPDIGHWGMGLSGNHDRVVLRFAAGFEALQSGHVQRFRAPIIQSMNGGIVPMPRLFSQHPRNIDAVENVF